MFLFCSFISFILFIHHCFKKSSVLSPFYKPSFLELDTKPGERGVVATGGVNILFEVWHWPILKGEKGATKWHQGGPCAASGAPTVSWATTRCPTRPFLNDTFGGLVGILDTQPAPPSGGKGNGSEATSATTSFYRGAGLTWYGNPSSDKMHKGSPWPPSCLAHPCSSLEMLVWLNNMGVGEEGVVSRVSPCARDHGGGPRRRGVGPLRCGTPHCQSPEPSN